MFLVPTGSKIFVGEVFRADKADGVAVAWKENGRLGITYRQARVFHFTNSWYGRDIGSGRTVQISLNGVGSGVL